MSIRVISLFFFLIFNTQLLFGETIFDNGTYKKHRIEIGSINSVHKYLRRSSSNILKGLFSENPVFKKNKKFILYVTYEKKKKIAPFKRARIFIGKYVYNLLYIDKYKVYYLTNTNPRDGKINNIFLSPSDIYTFRQTDFSIGKPLKRLTTTSPFNPNRLHPVLGVHRPHHGIDYRGKVGTPIYAVADGQIIYAGRNGSYGNYIKIKHRNGYLSEYAHLSKYYKGTRYLKRRWVKKGDIIGYVGSTGRSTGPHLHFGVKKGNKFINPEMLYAHSNYNEKIRGLSIANRKLRDNHGLMRAIRKVSSKIDRFGS